MEQLQAIFEFVVSCGQSAREYPQWSAFETKCKAEGLNDAAIAAFKYNYTKLASGANLMMPEGAIEPVDSLPSYESLTEEDVSLLSKTVMLKLNGGLGTGMGLEKAKSLLKLKGADTFLDCECSSHLLRRGLRAPPSRCGVTVRSRPVPPQSSRSRCCTCATSSACRSRSCS